MRAIRIPRELGASVNTQRTIGKNCITYIPVHMVQTAIDGQFKGLEEREHTGRGTISCRCNEAIKHF